MKIKKELRNGEGGRGLPTAHCSPSVDDGGLVRLRCPDCKVTIERRKDAPAYESIECPRCERYITRMFWITLNQANMRI